MKVSSSVIYFIYCKNFYKCQNVSPPSKTTNKKIYIQIVTITQAYRKWNNVIFRKMYGTEKQHLSVHKSQKSHVHTQLWKLDHKAECNYVICRQRGGRKCHPVEWNKPISKNQGSYMLFAGNFMEANIILLSEISWVQKAKDHIFTHEAIS
jgi:hypothetical protein